MHSNVFGFPWALTETTKNKGYGFRTVQQEEREHIARGADAITLRTRTGQDFVIRSKNKKGEPYGVRKEETETLGVMQVIRPATAPQPAPSSSNPTYSYQPAFNAGYLRRLMPAYRQHMMPPPAPIHMPMNVPPYMAQYGFQNPSSGHPYLAASPKTLLPALRAPPAYGQPSMPGPEHHENTKTARPQPYPSAAKEGEKQT